jgi:hypothetical protein
MGSFKIFEATRTRSRDDQEITRTSSSTLARLAHDTIKELVKERVKEVAFDPGTTFVEVIQPQKPVRGVFPTEILGGGSLPFALATSHQAPDAMVGAQLEATVPALDAQLVALAEAITGLDAARAQLQAQYDATDQLLKQAVDAAHG